MDISKIKLIFRRRHMLRRLPLPLLASSLGMVCILSTPIVNAVEASTAPASLASSKTAMLEVIDSYVELHTAPDRG